jgi:putative FmdB family regulatory protein
MPTYEFACEKCKKIFAQVWTVAEYQKRAKDKNKCPACGSSRIVRKLSLFQVKTSKKS